MRIAVLGLVMLLTGCVNLKYHPAEYVLDESRIANFPVSGSVSIKNAPVNDGVMTIFDKMVTWTASRNEINSALSNQLQKEIDRHGVVQGEKPINLWVSLNQYHGIQPGVLFKVNVDFTISDHNGFQKTFNVTDTTNGNLGGDIVRSFNGAIAVSVIHALKDPEFLAYLKK